MVYENDNMPSDPDKEVEAVDGLQQTTDQIGEFLAQEEHDNPEPPTAAEVEDQAKQDQAKQDQAKDESDEE